MDQFLSEHPGSCYSSTFRSLPPRLLFDMIIWKTVRHVAKTTDPLGRVCVSSGIVNFGGLDLVVS